ncbi:hypothetical protein D3C84_1194670 [compost metagenome]
MSGDFNFLGDRYQSDQLSRQFQFVGVVGKTVIGNETIEWMVRFCLQNRVCVMPLEWIVLKTYLKRKLPIRIDMLQIEMKIVLKKR